MFLTLLPVWLSGLILVGLPTLLAVGGQVLLRRNVGLERLRSNNEVAGFKFAAVGVLYAVLLAFAVIVVWERFSDAESRVSEEAGAAATIYRLADGIDERTSAALRDRLSAYLNAVIDEEWPAMERGESSLSAAHALHDVYSGALMLNPADRRGAVLLAEILRQLDVVTQARRARTQLGGRHCAGHRLVRPVRGRRYHRRLHVLLRHGESSRPDTDDRSTVRPDLLRIAYHRGDRPSIRGFREGDAGGTLGGPP